MKLTIDPRELRAALTVARRIVPRRSTLPILEHVLLTAGNGGVTVESTDLNARCLRTVPAVTAEGGAVCLPARALSDVLAVFRREVSLETDGKTARVTGDGAELTMPALAAEKFPSAPTLGERTGSLSINARTFRQMAEGAARSAAPDDMRPVLAGIQLVASYGRLTVAAADGFRLRVQTVETWPGDLSALVPWRSLVEAVRSLKADEVISLETFDGQLKLTAPGGWWLLRTIDGAYPDYRRIIPKPETIRTRVTLDTDDLRRVATLALGRRFLGFATPGGALTIKMHDADSLSGTFAPAADVCGEPVKFALHPRFLRDALADAGARVTLEIVGPTSVVTVRAADESNVRHYVMTAHVVE